MSSGPSRFTLAILCGGPSLERGISLNSARSVCDHLHSDEVEIVPIYLDPNRTPYRISRAHLYSNTPDDFDFKLKKIASPLSREAFGEVLASVDLVFPVMHGGFGEDGQIQALLENLGRPFVGSSSRACRAAFDKYTASQGLRQAGFPGPPCLLVERDAPNPLGALQRFFAENGLSQAVVKPARGGSSIGVYFAGSPAETLRGSEAIFKAGIDTRAVVEPVCQGREFTILVLENRESQPVALLPVEIELLDTGQVNRPGEPPTSREFFDYRNKYLATGRVKYHCPARFADDLVAQIRGEAERLFASFGMNGFARLDGWVLEDRSIWFSDLNTVSGMEQNSFLFIQAAELGLSHSGVLRYLIETTCLRYGIDPPRANRQARLTRQPVDVIFGGTTAERHVSLMSGTNVWLKLRQSSLYEPRPCLLEKSLDGQRIVWRLPYSLCLYHTVEEINSLCLTAAERQERIAPLRAEILSKLTPSPVQCTESDFLPVSLKLSEFVAQSSCVFIALHGGLGENGELQAMLRSAGVAYTGSGAQASRLCMDKYATGQAIQQMAAEGIHTARKQVLPLTSLASRTPEDFEKLWADLRQSLGSPTIIVKPAADGCSAGVVRLFGGDDLRKYVGYASCGVTSIPRNTLANQAQIVEMPSEIPEMLLFENFVETLRLSIKDSQLLWPDHRVPWIEITAGVVGPQGALHCMTPSMTVAESDVLSLEEKFQGGTGVNLTPPPPEIVAEDVLVLAKHRLEKVAHALGISGFARIDAFLNARTGEIVVIEANTVPGMSPSTVLFHQALAEPEPLYPRQFLEKVLEFRSNPGQV